MKEVKYVLVWGTSARHYPQHCGLGHVLNDEDVVQIVKKKVNLSLCCSLEVNLSFCCINILSPGLYNFSPIFF